MKTYYFSTMLFLLLSILAVSPPVFSQADAEQASVIGDNHRIISKKIIDIANGIDNYFYKYDETTVSLENKSYILLEHSSTFEKGGDLDNKFRLRGKVDLPNTKRHLNLFFDSNNDERVALDEKLLASRENTSSEDSSFGIESSEQKLKNWQRKFRLGLRVNANFDAYAKLSFRRKDDLGDIWHTESRQEFRYSHREAWGSHSTIDFIRPMGAFSTLRFSTSIYYRDENDVIELAQIASLLTNLSHNRSIEYKVGVLGSSGLSPETTDYFIGLHYRSPFYRPWLSLSLYPELIFSKEHNFTLDPRLTLKLQMVFSGKNN
jgi:hypothetical protein